MTAKNISVERVGKTDHYTNGVASVESTGILTVETNRPRKRVTYAPGRWIQVTETGVTNAE